MGIFGRNAETPTCRIGLRTAYANDGRNEGGREQPPSRVSAIRILGQPRWWVSPWLLCWISQRVATRATRVKISEWPRVRRISVCSWTGHEGSSGART